MQSLTVQLEMPFRLDIIGQQIRVAGQDFVYRAVLLIIQAAPSDAMEVYK